MSMLTRNERHGLIPTGEMMDDLMNAIFSDFPVFPAHFLNRVPQSRLEVKVNEHDVTVKLPAPGCKPTDFEIECEGSILTVKVAGRELPGMKENQHCTTRERSFAEYEESVKLPVEIRGGEAKAKYIDGVLEIAIPRQEACKITSKMIQVQ